MLSVQEELSENPPIRIGEASFQTTMPMLQALPVPLLMARIKDHTIFFVNQKFCSLVNTTPDNIVGHQTLESFFPSSLWNILQDILFEYGSFPDYELTLHHGHHCSIKGNISSELLFYNREPMIMVCFYPLKTSPPTNNLKSSSGIFPLTQNFPGMIYRCRVDEDLTMEFVSQGCEKLTGYHAKDMVENHTLSFHEITHPEDKKTVYHKILKALQQEQPFEIEYRIITKTGEQKWVWEKGKGVFLEGEQRFIVEGFITDITEHQRTKKSLNLLQNISQSISQTSNLQEALEIALRKICEATQWELGEAWLPNSDNTLLECSPAWYCSYLKEDIFRQDKQHHFHLIWSYFKPEVERIRQEKLAEFRNQSLSRTFALKVGLPGKVWRFKQPQWIPDVSIEPQFLRHEFAKDCGLKAGLGVPVLVNGQVVAILVFFMSQSCPKNRRLVELVSAVTSQLGMFLQYKDAEAKYRGIVENALEGIFQTTPDGHYINANPALARIYGYDSPQQLMQSLTDIEHQLYLNPNRRHEFIGLLQEQDSVSEFESQVFKRDGTVIWISENARAVRNENGVLSYYEGTVEDITQTKEVTAKLHWQAFYDPLTSLPNRAFFMNCLKTVIHRFNYPENFDKPYQFALLFLDLDRFKVVNDSLGHLVGDQLLIAIGHRLQHCLREQDTVARLGGDEFTILLEDIHDLQQVIAIAQRINQELKNPFLLHRHQVFTGASIGILWHDGQDNTGRQMMLNKQPEDLLRDADIALYKAKSSGKGCYAIFDPEMHQTAIDLLTLENSLRQALERQEFTINYQPIFTLKPKQKLVGFEALLRWKHPEKGLLYPQDFISVAEETGLIIAIGNWMLREVCLQLNCWHHLLGDEHLMVHVNLSSKQFLQTDLIQNLDQILQDTKISGESLTLEISEGYGFKDSKFTTQQMTNIRERNIQLCIDDFGTGYSCLSYLSQLPINALKIDGSFVSKIDQDPRQAEIAKTLVLLAQNLGLKAIAEGVETPEQLRKMQEINCDFAQGNLLSKPLNVEEATASIHII